MQLMARSPMLSVLVVVLAVLIFAIDAMTPLDIAIAVLYVVVVLLSASVFARRGVVVTSVVCMLLTLTAFVMSHVERFSGPATGRMLVSLAAISITALLALRGQASAKALLLREESLRRSQTNLAHATRITTLGELAGSIAHEVNQPLAAISANGEACLRWMNRPEPDMGEAQSAVTRMLSETQRATEVIRRIRALARKSDPQHTVLDLNQVVQETVQLVRRELLAHGVELALTLQPNLAPVCGDRVQLQQVIINLLMNGMQAMSTAGDGDALLSVRTANLDDGGVQLTVIDSGHGIPAADLPRLFEAFYTTKEDGMGMGLPICRSIIEAHGGRIWAAAALARGAVLNFSLPPVPADRQA